MKSGAVNHKGAATSTTNLHDVHEKHDTTVHNAPSPKEVVKMAATKAKKAGKDPTEAAKKAITEMAKTA